MDNQLINANIFEMYFIPQISEMIVLEIKHLANLKNQPKNEIILDLIAESNLRLSLLQKRHNECVEYLDKK